MNDSEMIIDPIAADARRAYQILCHLCSSFSFRKLGKKQGTFPSRDIEQKLATRSISFPESLRALRRIARDPASLLCASQLISTHGRISLHDARVGFQQFLIQNEHLIDSDKSTLILPTSAR